MIKKMALAAAALAMVAPPAAWSDEGNSGKPAVPSGFAHYEPEPAFPETVSTSFYHPLRDGVRVAMRVFRPARDGRPVEGRFPVIWHHTLMTNPESNWSGKAPGLPSIPSLTRHGYIVVLVARRGNGPSFGEMRGYHDRNEAQDAYEITQWLASQPWSSGRVGIYGCSNTGDAAMHAMTVRPPALKAVFAGCFSWHKYDAFRRGGIFAQWGTGPTRTIEQDMRFNTPVDGDEEKVLLRQAVEEHQRAPKLLELWKGLPYRNSYSSLVASRFWQEGSAANYADQIRQSGAALYIQGGWYDELRDQGLIAWLNVPGSRIVVGPWKHCRNDDLPLLEEAHRFFDYHLKGIDTGIASDQPIHYFTVNAEPGSEWRSARSWPVPGTENERSYLTAAGGLAVRAPKKAKASTSFGVKYDIECPDAGKGPFDSGPFAQPCHVEGWGTSFAQKPVRSDTEVTGSPVAEIWIAGDAGDANVFAYLEDVAPDGSVTMVTEGRLKASVRATQDAPWKMFPGVPWHRAFVEDASPLTPGTPARLTFDLMPTSYIFKAGHRIQVTLTGADPRERLRDESGLAKRIEVLADKAHPSWIDLPVVKH